MNCIAQRMREGVDPYDIQETEAAMDAAAIEITRLRRELGEAQATIIHLTAHVRDAGVDCSRLRRVNAELVEALESFVNFARAELRSATKKGEPT